MRIEAENKKETTLDDNASIYQKREEKSGKEIFKDLDREGKWQFFKDYVQKKLLLFILIAAVVACFLYSILKPKPEVMFNIVVFDNPFTVELEDSIKSDLTELFVTDEDRQQVVLDTTYYLTDEYSTRMKFMTSIAAAEIDAMIIPKSEFQNQVNAGTIETLDRYLSAELYERLVVYRVNATPHETELDKDGKEITVTGENAAYGLDITNYISSLYGQECDVTYYLVFPANTKKAENIDAFVKYIYGIN